jgi:glycosyltransferase involved in cell wall biosynthesis
MQAATEVPGSDEDLLILIPVFNDWAALGRLLVALDRVLDEHGLPASVLVVDDGSTDDRDLIAPAAPFRALRRVDVLELRRNLGHQRAIAIGLAYAEANEACRALVVMDSDGEDDPRDVPRLFARYRAEGGEKIVFAERTRRSESRLFRVFYALYKVMHRLLTGFGVRVGNFSIIPRRRLASLVVVSELWNHYAAAAFKSRQPYCTIPTVRARRLHGRSTMNFVGLVAHGLSAISVYSETVGVRLLVVALLMALLALAGLAGVVAVRLATSWAIPGWATTVAGLLLILLSQAVMLAFLFSFLVLGGRNGPGFIPCRDYHFYINKISKNGLYATGGTGLRPAAADVGV